MYNSLCLMLLWYGGVAYGITTKHIEGEVNSYFSSDTVRSFSDKWKVHQTSVENAIELSLKETLGNSGLNVYVKTLDDSHKVSDGFLVYDNVVHVLFKDMNLVRYPYLKNPRVSFPLHENVLQVEATVSKMFVDAKYLLFRNFSDVVYTAVQGGQGTSPFSLQQVQNRGRAMIVVEHCVLFGYAVASLQGVSVALGQDNFKLNNCRFSLEISTPGIASAPLIVPYFSEKQGTQLERLLMLSLHKELMPKLQGAVLTCVNTSSALGSLLPKVRKQQRSLFKKTSDYMSHVIESLNKITSDNNAGSELWKDYRLSWTDKYDDNLLTSVVRLTNLTISGLDSAYSAHVGGPYKQRSFKIDESVRFSGIQFRGAGIFKVRTAQTQFIFSGEVQDVMTSATFQIAMDEDKENPPKALISSKDVQTFELRGWRNLEIHSPNSPLVNTYSLITGYLLNQIPVVVVSHLSRFCREAIDDTDNPNTRQKSNAESIAKPISGEEKLNDNENENTNLPSDRDAPNDSNQNDNTYLPSDQDGPNDSKLPPISVKEGSAKPMFDGKFFADGKNNPKKINAENSKSNDDENTNLPSDQDAPDESNPPPADIKEGSNKNMLNKKLLSGGTSLIKDSMFAEPFFADGKNNPKKINVENSESIENENANLPSEQDAPDDGNDNENTNLPSDQDAPEENNPPPADIKEGSNKNMLNKKLLSGGTSLIKDSMFAKPFFADGNNNPKERNVKDLSGSEQDNDGTLRRKHFKKPVRSKNYRRNQKLAHMANNEIN